MTVLLLDNNYKVFLDKVIGEGSFSKVYLGMNIKNNRFLAVKTEDKKTKYGLLEKESNIIRYVNQNLDYNPVIDNYWFGYDKNRYYLFTDLLGSSLEQLFKICGKKFTLKTVLILAEQMINRVRFYHDRNIIHRDIKPDNFLLEYNRPAKYIYLIDFGLGKKYRKSTNNEHIPYKENQLHVGTVRYMSINAHEKKEQSRRDDMYSLGYILI